VELGYNSANDGIVWHVYFPEERRPDARIRSHPGASFAVDETTRTCTRTYAN
jgi:hypothetical protein